MMAVPGKTNSGLRSSRLVEFVDIFPTIAEAAGLPKLDTCPDPSNSTHICTGLYQSLKVKNRMSSFMISDDRIRIHDDLSNSSNTCTEGSSLMPLIEDPESYDWKKAVFWQYPRLTESILWRIKCLLRGGKIVDHLMNTMGYSMRTAEWRYTEWVGIALYNISATKDMLVSALL